MLENLKPPVKQWPCKVRSVADKLDAADKKILLEAVDNPDWKYQTLENALASRGVALGGASIKAHRNRACSCFRVI